MSKTYFIDSENVGDSWISLLDYIEEDSKYLVFYTNHSPCIHYEGAIKLMNVERKPEFIHCSEGNNALDFQLVSYLGYQLRSNESEEVIIVTNDTGFDAVVNFWLERNIKISRFPLKNNVTDIEEVILPVSTEEVANPTVVKKKKKAQKNSPISETEITKVVNCVGKKNLNGLSMAFIHFYGNQKGLELYKKLKSSGFNVPDKKWKPKERMENFCSMIFEYCDESGVGMPDDLVSYLYSVIASNDNKKTLKKKIDNHYSGDTSSKLNKILKPFYDILIKMKK